MNQAIKNLFERTNKLFHKMQMLRTPDDYNKRGELLGEEGRCMFCGTMTHKKITWSSNDPKVHGKTDWICEDCYYKEL